MVEVAAVVVDDLEVIEVDMVVAVVEEARMVVAIHMVEDTTAKVQGMVDRVVVAIMVVKEEAVMVEAKMVVVMVVAKEVVARMVNIIKMVVGIILNLQDNMVVAVVMAHPNLQQATANPQVDKVTVVNHLQEVKVSNTVVVTVSLLHQPAMALALMDNKHLLPLQVIIRAMVKVLVEDMVVVHRLLQEGIPRVPVMVAQQELVMVEAVEELAVMVNKQVSCIARPMAVPLLGYDFAIFVTKVGFFQSINGLLFNSIILFCLPG